MELKAEGEKSGHPIEVGARGSASSDPLGDLLNAAENADFEGVAQGTPTLPPTNLFYYLTSLLS